VITSEEFYFNNILTILLFY